jgi:hypothetical protein
LQRRNVGSITIEMRCSYGLKHDLDQHLCRTHFDGGNVPDLQNEHGPDPGGELQITNHVSILRLYHGPLQSELPALRKAIARRMNFMTR